MIDPITGEVLPIAQFAASLPPTASALKVHGTDGEVRLQLSIPGLYMAEALRVLALAGTAFTITIHAGEPS